MSVPQLTVKDVPADARIYNARPEGHAGVIAAIVKHHTGGTDSLHHLSTYHDFPVSIHKLVPKKMPDGKAGHYQIVLDKDRASHVGESLYAGRDDWNDFSIGIEVENMGDGLDPYTPEQYECVAQIIAYQCALHHIPDDMVRDHKEVAIARGRKSDMKGWDDVRMWKRITEIRTQWPANWPAFWACMR